MKINYRNIEKNKQLHAVRMDIDAIIRKINIINNEEQASEIRLGEEVNRLFMRTNGVYGGHQKLFDAENFRLAKAWREMWDRVDNN